MSLHPDTHPTAAIATATAAVLIGGVLVTHPLWLRWLDDRIARASELIGGADDA